MYRTVTRGDRSFFYIIGNCTFFVLHKRIEILVMLSAPTLK